MKNNNADEIPTLLTTKETAKYLGIKPGTMAQCIHRGKPILPYYKIGRTVRYSLDDIKKHLELYRMPRAIKETEIL